MNVSGKHYRTVWMQSGIVHLIEQNLLPFEFKIFKSPNYLTTCKAITTMITRGAGAIGGTAAYAMAQAALEAPKSNYLQFIKEARSNIEATRPTAYDLFYSVKKVFEKAKVSPEKAVSEAVKIADENTFAGKKIGEYGNTLIHDGMNIETHCNAGWLAFVDYGSALSPIYTAHRSGKNIFVYVDETRPRSQGARLTAWELSNEGVPHAIIADNAGAYFMSKQKIDMIIVGADRIARNGDAANKIGTLEKAIAAKYYGIPFYVAAPSSTIDTSLMTGSEIIIEQRSQDEVHLVSGMDSDNKPHTIRCTNPDSIALNPAFDVTPAKLINGIITEKGIIKPTAQAIKAMMDE